MGEEFGGGVSEGEISPPLEIPIFQLPHAHLNVEAHSEADRFAHSALFERQKVLQINWQLQVALVHNIRKNLLFQKPH